MDSLEVNIKLKEDILVLEKMYKELVDSIAELYSIPHTVHSTLKMINLMCSEQVKAQKGEESCQIKFSSVEDFAYYLKLMSDITLKYLEEKYKI